jgi:hypothetical protein
MLTGALNVALLVSDAAERAAALDQTRSFPDVSSNGALVRSCRPRDGKPHGGRRQFRSLGQSVREKNQSVGHRPRLHLKGQLSTPRFSDTVDTCNTISLK